MNTQELEYLIGLIDIMLIDEIDLTDTPLVGGPVVIKPLPKYA